MDDELEVGFWLTPFYIQNNTNNTSVIAIDAPGLKPPHWWKGDEEASQSFLTAMGVKLNA